MNKLNQIFYLALIQHIWMPVPYVYLNTALVFRLMWAIRTLELGLLATLESNMPYHVLLVSITLSTHPAPEVLLFSMKHHIMILHSYWHEWKVHINIRGSKLSCHANTTVLSVKTLTNMSGDLLKTQIPFEFCCTKMVKFTLFQFCNRMV